MFVSIFATFLSLVFVFLFFLTAQQMNDPKTRELILQIIDQQLIDERKDLNDNEAIKDEDKYDRNVKELISYGKVFLRLIILSQSTIRIKMKTRNNLMKCLTINNDNKAAIGTAMDKFLLDITRRLQHTSLELIASATRIANMFLVDKQESGKPKTLAEWKTTGCEKILKFFISVCCVVLLCFFCCLFFCFVFSVSFAGVRQMGCRVVLLNCHIAVQG